MEAGITAEKRSLRLILSSPMKKMRYIPVSITMSLTAD